MIKYQYQPEKQTRSWIDSILRSKTDISAARTKVKKTVWNKITYEELLHQYQAAIASASKETGKDLRRVPKLFPDPCWASVRSITESSFIEDFFN